MKTIYLILFFSCLSLFTFAQDQIIISGRILDKNTKAPVAYSHIGIASQGIGTTSGHNGDFELKIRAILEHETLTVSFMGYQTFKKQIKDIKGPITIYLEKANYELSEVVVADEAAVENIIRKAVARIPKNYSTHPTINLGFYREAKTNDSLQYYYLAEGVLNIYKHSYKKSKEGSVSMVQGRRINLTNPLDTILRGGLTSGHMAAHRFDFVQNREDFINEKYFPVYKYWIQGITTYDGRPVYIIGFAPDPNAQDIEVKDKGFNGGGIFNIFLKKKRIIKEGGRMEGEIYIDKNSYAFIKTEFRITKKGLKKTNDYPLYAGGWHANNYVVNYRKVGDKWFFSDATREGILRSGNRYSNEVRITDINPDKAKQLPYLDRIGKGVAFSRLTGKYDPDFWDNYNITPLNEELAESVQQLENALQAQEAFDKENMLKLQELRDSIYQAEIEAREIERRKMEGEVDELEKVDLSPLEVKQLVRLQKLQSLKKDYTKFKFHMGLGSHLLSSQLSDLAITLLDDEEAPQTILTLTDDIKNREFEVVAHWDADIFFHRNFYIRFGTAFDFYNSIYKERSLGIGTEINLSKQRPFYLKAIAQYAHLRYARKLGVQDNDYGTFKFDGKKINSSSVNLYYGNQVQSLKLSAEMSIELNPGKEFYVRGTYNLPFANRRQVWVKERRQLFRKKDNASLDKDYIQVTQNDVPFTGNLIGDPSFLIAVGWVFKG